MTETDLHTTAQVYFIIWCQAIHQFLDTLPLRFHLRSGPVREFCLTNPMVFARLPICPAWHQTPYCIANSVYDAGIEIGYAEHLPNAQLLNWQAEE